MKNHKTSSHSSLVPKQDTAKPLISQKGMDITLMIVSSAGLICAFLFFITIVR